MPLRDIRRAALTSIISSAITLGPALDADHAGAQSVHYRSPEGVEYRSLPDTDAVKSARATLEANPRNIACIIDLGVAESGARQFREAIATFTRGLEIEPNNALLLRWRRHRQHDLRNLVPPRCRPVPARRLCRGGGIVRQGSADRPGRRRTCRFHR